MERNNRNTGYWTDDFKYGQKWDETSAASYLVFGRASPKLLGSVFFSFINNSLKCVREWRSTQNSYEIHTNRRFVRQTNGNTHYFWCDTIEMMAIILILLKIAPKKTAQQIFQAFEKDYAIDERKCPDWYRKNKTHIIFLCVIGDATKLTWMLLVTKEECNLLVDTAI